MCAVWSLPRSHSEDHQLTGIVYMPCTALLRVLGCLFAKPDNEVQVVEHRPMAECKHPQKHQLNGCWPPYICVRCTNLFLSHSHCLNDLTEPLQLCSTSYLSHSYCNQNHPQHNMHTAISNMPCLHPTSPS